MACQTPKTLRVGGGVHTLGCICDACAIALCNFRIYHPSAQLAAPFARACILGLRRLAGWPVFWIWNLDGSKDPAHKTLRATDLIGRDFHCFASSPQVKPIGKWPKFSNNMSLVCVHLGHFRNPSGRKLKVSGRAFTRSAKPAPDIWPEVGLC